MLPRVPPRCGTIPVLSSKFGYKMHRRAPVCSLSTVMMRHRPREAIAHAFDRIEPQRSRRRGQRLPGRSRREPLDVFEARASQAGRRMNLVLHNALSETFESRPSLRADLRQILLFRPEAVVAVNLAPKFQLSLCFGCLPEPGSNRRPSDPSSSRWDDLDRTADGKTAIPIRATHVDGGFGKPVRILVPAGLARPPI